MTDPTPGRLVLVTGARASGTTTVAYAVAARLPRAVHVDGEAVHAMVVSGGVPASLVPRPEAVEQLFLRWLAALALAETYQRAGFDAVLSDHVVGELLDDFLDFVSPAPLHLVVLHPAVDALRRRRTDPVTGTPDEGREVTVEALHATLETGTRRVGLWLDSTDLDADATGDATADAVLERLDEALVETGSLLPPPG